MKQLFAGDDGIPGTAAHDPPARRLGRQVFRRVVDGPMTQHGESVPKLQKVAPADMEAVEAFDGSPTALQLPRASISTLAPFSRKAPKTSDCPPNPGSLARRIVVKPNSDERCKPVPRRLVGH